MNNVRNGTKNVRNPHILSTLRHILFTLENFTNFQTFQKIFPHGNTIILFIDTN